MKYQSLNKKTLAVFLVFCGMFSQMAFAQGQLRHSLGLENFYYDYTEEVNNAYLMSLRGQMMALVGDVEYQPENWCAAFRFDGRVATSFGDSLKYNSATTGRLEEPSYYFEGRFLTYFDVHQNWRLFVGPGVRHLINDTAGKFSSTGAAGYMRKNTLLYLAQGVEHQAALAHQWRMVSQAELDVLIKGWQYSGAVGGFDNEQDRGWGVRLGTKFVKPCKSFEIAVGPFFRYWNIDDSDIVVAKNGKPYFEPKNTTKEIGLQVNFSVL